MEPFTYVGGALSIADICIRFVSVTLVRQRFKANHEADMAMSWSRYIRISVMLNRKRKKRC